ncbi:MAG: glycosyltransferase [Planctomycetota bacterium]
MVETVCENRLTRAIDVLCFGGEDWWYHNRGHIDMQLMRRFGKLGTTVYVNSIVMQKPKLSQGRKFVQKAARKARSIFSGLKKTDADIWVYSPFSMPVHHISWAKGLNQTMLARQIRRVVKKLDLNDIVVWVACPAACNVAIDLQKAKLVYQRTDRYEEYPNVDRNVITEYDRKLKASADVTIFVSQSLYEQERSQCRRAFFLDHGVDYEMFADAERSDEKPEDIAGIPGPVVGFFGGIDDHTSDIPFVEKVVDLLGEMSFVFVGKASSDCSVLQAKPNVSMLGQKPYEQIPHYGKCFDVAIMPWRQNQWIEACNPIKLKEYLALGKPVVSTPFAELRKYLDVVYQADTPEQFAESIKRAFDEDCPERISARREKVKSSTWQSKADSVLDEIFAGDETC